MTDAALPAGDDSILPFQLDALDVRGRVARLDDTIDTILTQHDYPVSVSGLVAEATLLTALIGQTIKHGDRFSIQLRGSGPITMLATDYFAPKQPGEAARMRAYAAYDTEAELEGDGIALLGEGLMGVTIDDGRGQPYQGVTPLAGASLAECAEIYFAQSEQIATRFALASAYVSQPGKETKWRAGGVIIQHLPKASPLKQPDPPEPAVGPGTLMSSDEVAALSDTEDNWKAATLKLATVEEHELIGPHVTRKELLLRLFQEDSPRVYAPQTVIFGCTCSSSKLESVLAAYGGEQLDDMAEDGRIIGDCQFCGAQYVYDVEQLKQKAEQE